MSNQTISIELTEQEAEALGFALVRASRELKSGPSSDWANDLLGRIEDVREKLEGAANVL